MRCAQHFFQAVFDPFGLPVVGEQPATRRSKPILRSPWRSAADHHRWLTNPGKLRHHLP